MARKKDQLVNVTPSTHKNLATSRSSSGGGLSESVTGDSATTEGSVSKPASNGNDSVSGEDTTSSKEA